MIQEKGMMSFVVEMVVVLVVVTGMEVVRAAVWSSSTGVAVSKAPVQVYRLGFSSADPDPPLMPSSAL